MKKFAIYSILLTILLISAVVPAHAQLGSLTPPPATNVKIGDIIFGFIEYGIASGAVVFFIMFIWGALQWISSEGDKGGLAGARGRMTSAIIGLILLGLSFTIYKVVTALTFDPNNGAINSAPTPNPSGGPF